MSSGGGGNKDRGGNQARYEPSQTQKDLEREQRDYLRQQRENMESDRARTQRAESESVAEEAEDRSRFRREGAFGPRSLVSRAGYGGFEGGEQSEGGGRIWDEYVAPKAGEEYGRTDRDELPEDAPEPELWQRYWYGGGRDTPMSYSEFMGSPVYESFSQSSGLTGGGAYLAYRKGFAPKRKARSDNFNRNPYGGLD